MDLNNYLLTEELFLVRNNIVKVSEQPRAYNTEDMYNVFYDFWKIGEIGVFESFKVMFLNKNSRVMGIIEVGRGAINSCIVDQRIVFAAALKIGATFIVLAHNHPSCSMKPSKEDIELTNNLKKCGEILGIQVLDHLILTLDGYVSMKELKLL